MIRIRRLSKQYPGGTRALDDVSVSAWGNRGCVRGNLDEFKGYRRWHSLRNDPRVPLSEAEQIHRILQEKGLRTELLVYQDEGHGLAKLPNRLDAYPKVADFLDEVLMS